MDYRRKTKVLCAKYKKINITILLQFHVTSCGAGSNNIVAIA